MMPKEPNLSNTAAIKLIVGLGNPGPEYAMTRHNAGFWFIERLCEQYHAYLTPEKKFKASLAKITISNQPCVILQPSTYMNLSGDPLQQVTNFYKIPLSECLVVHDDLDLPPGAARLKFDGGHGGHNGLRDIFSKTGTKAFFRLRLGIGHPRVRDQVHDYVLHRPSKADQALINDAIDSSLAVLPDIVEGKTEKAMQALHTVTKPASA